MRDDRHTGAVARALHPEKSSARLDVRHRCGVRGVSWIQIVIGGSHEALIEEPRGDARAGSALAGLAVDRNDATVRVRQVVNFRVWRVLDPEGGAFGGSEERRKRVAVDGSDNRLAGGQEELHRLTKVKQELNWRRFMIFERQSRKSSPEAARSEGSLAAQVDDPKLLLVPRCEESEDVGHVVSVVGLCFPRRRRVPHCDDVACDVAQVEVEVALGEALLGTRNESARKCLEKAGRRGRRSVEYDASRNGT